MSMIRQIVRDPDFENGFTVLSQKDHQNGDKVTELGVFAYNGDTSPSWKLAQWDSGPCIWANRIYAEPSALTDGSSKLLRWRPADKSLTFRLDTSVFYGGKPAAAGAYWPHLLIEQGGYQESAGKKIVVSMDLRMTEYEQMEIENDYVRAAQFLMYLYMRGKSGRDFVWFGLHLFDSRCAMSDKYIGYDGGKADASGAMIYNIGGKDIYANCPRSLWVNGKPEASDEWLSIAIDVRPHLEDMLEYGLRDGYFKDVRTADDLCVCGMNIGWETIAAFRHTMHIKNLRIENEL